MTLTFSAGATSGTTQTVTVQITDDGNPEPDEVINIQLSGLSVGTDFAIISSGSGTGNITIVDDDRKLLSHLTCITKICCQLLVTIKNLFRSSHISCSVVTCPDPPGIANGMRTFTGNLVGDTATYTCNSDFELIGNPTTACTEDAGGNSASFPTVPPPMCRREYFLNITRILWSGYMPSWFVSIMPE